MRVVQEVRGVRRHSPDPAAPGSPRAVPAPPEFRDSLGAAFGAISLPVSLFRPCPQPDTRLQLVSAADLLPAGPRARWAARGPASVSRITETFLAPPGARPQCTRRTPACCVSVGLAQPPGDFQIHRVVQRIRGKVRVPELRKTQSSWECSRNQGRAPRAAGSVSATGPRT